MGKKRWSGPREVHIPPERRLTATYYTDEQCELALQGKQILQAVGHIVTRSCVIRGIRYHPGFATELHGDIPIFTRALNAREIMSDNIPEMSELEEFPYCIWYPSLAKESTYRELARRYPQMKYQVGRACAVAGYTELYRELNLSPEVHIAEEARGNGGEEIFNDIIAHSEKLSLMDDYTATIISDPPKRGTAFVNGDTAVRSSLELKRRYHEQALPQSERDCYFNITEDFCLDVDDFVPQSMIAANTLAVSYLYTPLPIDLPPVQKDILIVLAAYRGDIDRYSRLRRPGIFVDRELSCIIRGIYHSTFFAKWWSSQLRSDDTDIDNFTIKKAITARAIMKNDLSRITPAVSKLHVPYCIWYLKVPRETTLELLVKRRSDMVQQVARVCIVGDYQTLYAKLNPTPDFALLAEAKASNNTYFLTDLEQKVGAAEGGSGRGIAGSSVDKAWKKHTVKQALLPSFWSNDLIKEVVSQDVVDYFDWLYDGTRADISRIELHISAMLSDSTLRAGDSVTAFGGSFDKELMAEGTVDVDTKYEEELEQIARNESGGVSEAVYFLRTD